MLKPFSTIVIITTMLIAFIGQALAYSAMSCEMSANHQHKMMLMETSSFHTGMDHSAMPHKEMAHNEMTHSDTQGEDTASADCCDNECTCPVNACSSFSLLTSLYYSASSDLTDVAIVNKNYSLHSLYPSSLYRPPIFA